MDGVIADVVAVLYKFRPVEELEESDWSVPMNRRYPTTTDGQMRMKPVSIFLCMIIPRSNCRLHSLPLIEPNQVLSISTIDTLGIKMGQLDQIAELSGKDNVGINVKYPVPGRDLVESLPDHPPLVENRVIAVWLVARVPVTEILFAHHKVNIVLATNVLGLCVVRRRHHDNVIKMGKIFPKCLLEKISVSD